MPHYSFRKRTEPIATMGFYWFGRLERPEWETPAYEVVVAQLEAISNLMSALTTVDVIDTWHPRAVLVVEIAGDAGRSRSGM